MRINVLQHTSNEGPGSIHEWSQLHNHDFYVYHPDQFGILPTAKQTDILIILGGPMSPNDNLDWIIKERELISQLMDQQKPILGVCFGAQQIVKTMGYQVSKAPVKEVGWGKVQLKSQTIPEIPSELDVLHWHEEMFEIPSEAKLLFSNKYLKNQGFILNDKIVGLQFHLEPQSDNVKEIVVNDSKYLKGSVLNQTAESIIQKPVPSINKTVMFKILDYISK